MPQSNVNQDREVATNYIDLKSPPTWELVFPLEQQSKCIFSCPLEKLSGKSLDLERFATPRRYRFVSLAAIRKADTLEIYEFEELPTFTGLGGLVHTYTAISYVWHGLALHGDSLDPLSIRASRRGNFTVNGGEHAVPISISVLEDICWAMDRNLSNQDILWLDQLCILQNHRKDKDWQIMNMYSIFANSYCLVLPGGLSRLATPEDETHWMDRAWTLQEVLAPETVSISILFAHHHITDDERGVYNGNYLDVEGGGTIVHAPFFELLTTTHTIERRMFGFEHAQTQALLGAMNSALPALSSPGYGGGYGGSKFLGFDGIWQCAIMRTSSRPVDMIFSIMHFFNVILDPSLFEPEDRAGATIALGNAILKQPQGRAHWLSALFFLPPSPEIPIFPQFPETTVDSRAVISMPDGSKEPVVDLMAKHRTNALYLCHILEPLKDGPGYIDDVGNYTFLAGVIIPLQEASLTSDVVKDSSDKDVFVNHEVTFNAADGSNWHPTYWNEKVNGTIHWNGVDVPSDAIVYRDATYDGCAFAISLGFFEGSTSDQVFMVMKKHGPGMFDRSSHFVSPAEVWTNVPICREVTVTIGRRT